jgi:hypothetical protein
MVAILEPHLMMYQSLFDQEPDMMGFHYIQIRHAKETQGEKMLI